jgi:hypothetical protein
MPTALRPTATDKRALLRIQADLRRLNIIKENQSKMVAQIQELVARYNKSETLASSVQKNVGDTLEGMVNRLG